ncbi:hypothetical protein OQA88_11367 [Cercophora sp. LCS_1]
MQPTHLSKKPTDEEKGLGHDVTAVSSSSGGPQNAETEEKRGFLGTLRYYEGVLDKKLGVETQAVTRKRPEDRDPAFRAWHNQAVMFLLWLSSTSNLSCFATGFLGHEFGLDLKTTLLVIIFGTLIGSAVPAWCATMGPKTGLRAVSIARYSMGWWPSKSIAVLNVIEQVGWCSIGAITGGLALSAISNGEIGSQLGVFLATLIGFIISFIGLKAVFLYEKYSGFVLLAVFIAMYAQTASTADLAVPETLTPSTLTKGCLCLLAVMYGSSSSWGSIIADFYVEYPASTSPYQIFTLTCLGIALPTIFGMSLGAIVASGLKNNPIWAAAHAKGMGFLVQEMIHPTGFAKFLLVVLALSCIGMVSVSLYSAGLSIQQTARPLGLVPRFFWTALMFGAACTLGMAGADKLYDFLLNFLSLLGYWVTGFFVIMFCEHYAFRKGWTRGVELYDLEAWNDPELLPVGYAGGLAFVVGLVGAILGMSEKWYKGVISVQIGGGDIGNQLAFLFTLAVFLPARWLERKIVGR